MLRARVAVCVLLLAAAAMALPAQSVPTVAGVNNKAPSVATVTMASSVEPTAGTTTSVTVTVKVDDPNGHNDVSGVTVRIYQPDNSTVHVADGSGAKTQGVQKRATYEYTFTMGYSDDPGTYYVSVIATDVAGASDTAWRTFMYQSLAALSVSASSLTLNPGESAGNEVQPGENTKGDPADVTITNAGNSAVDLEYSGTALSNGSGDTIAASSVKLGLASDMATEYALGTSAATLTSFDLAKGGSRTVYFDVYVPDGTPAGQYSSTITLAAVADS